MGTKSKNYHSLGIFAALLVILILSVTMVMQYPRFEAQAQKYEYGAYKTLRYDVYESLAYGSYALYYEALHAENPKLQPVDVFVDGEASDQNFISEVNRLFYDWEYELNYLLSDIDYAIYDEELNLLATNTTDMSLDKYVLEPTSAAVNTALYDRVIILNYNSSGIIFDYQLPDDTGEQTSSEIKNINKGILSLFENYYENALKPLANISVVYAIRADGDLFMDMEYWKGYTAYLQTGFIPYFIYFLIILTVTALVLSCLKPVNPGDFKYMRWPLEMAVVVLPLAAAFYDIMLELVMATNWGMLTETFQRMTISLKLQSFAINGVNVLCWAILFCCWFLGCLSIFQVFSIGPKRYIKERVWSVRVCIYVYRKIRDIIKWTVETDLEKRTEKKIILGVVVNFIVLSVVTCFWYLGIIGVFIYSIILYYLIRSYMIRIKKDYQTILNTAGQMAEGNLDVRVDEDAGVFNQMKDELMTVRDGFKKAVEKETASQNMRNELITNVSHDLKTPLTAIITYINLLKDGNLSSEEQHQYLETLDRKSMRLKALIEDLFEVSKVESRNITLDIVNVKIFQLMKQVYFELQDKIEEADLEFKMNLPEEDVTLSLDSQITYRIFENLMVNCVKYAMPGTRVYISSHETDDYIAIMIRNVSAVELNIEAERLTERFIRGDLARNTEGSGLGLAIAKSFAELQGGDLFVSIDGDLFKVTVQFKRQQVIAGMNQLIHK